MKKIFTILLLLSLLASDKIFAQYWNTNGGNLLTGGNFLGSSNPADLIFKTNSAEQMRLIGVAGTNQGWLGLNTSTPASVLHIDGNLTTTGELFRTVSPSGTTSYWRMYDDATPIFNINGTNTAGVNINSLATGPLTLSSSCTTAPLTLTSAANLFEFNGAIPATTNTVFFNNFRLSFMRLAGGFVSSLINVGIGEPTPTWSLVVRHDVTLQSTGLQFLNNAPTVVGGIIPIGSSRGERRYEHTPRTFAIQFITIA